MRACPGYPAEQCMQRSKLCGSGLGNHPHHLREFPQDLARPPRQSHRGLRSQTGPCPQRLGSAMKIPSPISRSKPPPQPGSPWSKPVLRPSLQAHQTHHLHPCVGLPLSSCTFKSAWGWSLGLGACADLVTTPKDPKSCLLDRSVRKSPDGNSIRLALSLSCRNAFLEG